MISRRTAMYGVGGALLVAYLAAANMPGADAPREPRAQPAAAPSTESLADEVRSQASRLRTRMADAPAPGSHPRNLFSFEPVKHDEPVRAPQPAGPDVAEPAAVPSAPALTLMGVAEEQIAGGVRRTAIIGGEADAIYMVAEGEPIGARYKVTKIGADAVELEDLVTHAYRRIALR